MQYTKDIFIIFVFYGLVTAQINLSPMGTATQSSTYSNYYASLVVTGGPTNNFSTGSCSHTGPNQQAAWWMLALPNNSLFVEQVNIFYRGTTPFRLDGYSLYVSNISISGLQKQAPPGFLCYKDPVDGTTSINQTVACNQIGQYVILYNDHRARGDYSGPILELCEVQVFGCSKHLFGSQCSQNCSLKCFDQHCYPSNGRCLFGCNCLDDTCDGNASCITGCIDGFTGQYCKEQCVSPNFGNNCLLKCHCNNQQMGCNNVDGTCPAGGCQDGWMGTSCSTVCPPTTFGENCMYTCHCKNQQTGCNHVDGTCPFGGCQDGWTGTSCSTECPPSTFGEDCKHICHCKSQQVGCYNIDGTCPGDGCQKGWQGKNCSTECKLGYYGFNCREFCHGCLSTMCNKAIGECTYTTRCNPGWVTELPFCQTLCPFPTFGENCSHICHCRNQSLGCNHIDGRCNVEGCVKGWYGENCSKVQLKSSSMSTEIIASVIATIFVVAVVAFVVFLVRKQKCLNGGTCIFSRPIRYVKKTDDKRRKDNMDPLYEPTGQINIWDHCYSTISPTVKSANVVKSQGKDIHPSNDYVNDAYELSDQIKNDNQSYTNLNLNVKALTAKRCTEIQYNNDVIYDTPDP